MQNLIFDAEHQDVMEKHHRYQQIRFKNEIWDLSHLNPFVIHFDPEIGFDLTIVVLFSCHCFSRSLNDRDVNIALDINNLLYDDGREVRVLDQTRYRLSRQFFPRIMHELAGRKIQVLATSNFLTFESLDTLSTDEKYVIFFDVKKDSRKKKRLLLRVQSAYALQKLNSRQVKAKKVRFSTLIKSAYECRPIRA